MRLVSLTLAGYRRFGERTKINLDGKLIALVGPNEAGKTTILEALARMLTSRRYPSGSGRALQSPPIRTLRSSRFGYLSRTTLLALRYPMARSRHGGSSWDTR